MSRMGFATSPGIAVLPTCSSISGGNAADATASKIRAASPANDETHRSSYGTSRTVLDSSPSGSCIERAAEDLRRPPFHLVYDRVIESRRLLHAREVRRADSPLAALSPWDDVQVEVG